MPWFGCSSVAFGQRVVSEVDTTTIDLLLTRGTIFFSMLSSGVYSVETDKTKQRLQKVEPTSCDAACSVRSLHAR